jgi:hypothetical protein
MATSFSFGFSGDDISPEAEELQREEKSSPPTTEGINQPEKLDSQPLLEPRLHNLKELVCHHCESAL